MPRLSVLLTGDVDAPEFAAARRRLAAETELRVASLDEAVASLEREAAALVVVAKSFPEQFSAARVEALRRAAPLARLIALEGSWCESEPRTGRPWPGVARVAWNAAEAALQREVAALERDEPSRWGGPATAAPFEAALWESELPLARGAGRVLVHALTPEHHAWLAAALRAFGYEPALPSGEPHAGEASLDASEPVARIVQTSPVGDPEWVARLRAVAEAPRLPTLVLLDFPRPQDVAAANEAGATGVLGLPCSLLDLSTALALAIERGHSVADLRRSVNDM